jgi:hypothetical protein
MLLKSLLPLLLLAISTLAGPSLHYLWPSNIFRVSMESPPDDYPLYSATRLTENVRQINEVVDSIREFHTTEFRFTTEELATYPEVNAVVEFLRIPLQAVIALGSDIDLYNCTAITDLLETCAVWSISANTTAATARSFLHATNARVDSCIEALGKLKQQNAFLEQLTQNLVDDHIGFVIGTLPLLETASTYEAPTHDFSARVSSFQRSTFTTSRILKVWNDEKDAVDEPLAIVHKSFLRVNESLATVVARCDDGFAEELPMLLRDCQDEHERLHDLS